MVFSVFGNKVDIKTMVLFIVLGMILCAYTYCPCRCGKEGFGDQLGSNLGYNIGEGVPGSFNKVSPPATYDSYFSSLDGNTQGLATPLQHGEMAIFSENKSSPECCPATYSTSMGCVCETPQQMKYLNERGGNRTQNSEF
jgi:hypothetical protein